VGKCGWSAEVGFGIELAALDWDLALQLFFSQLKKAGDVTYLAGQSLLSSSRWAEQGC
jgi:hypothetical protein